MAVSARRDTVRIDAPDATEVDRTPVTNAVYGEFVEATGHRTPRYWPGGVCPASLQEHPVVGVDFFDAIAYANWAGGRLPSEMEWVLASGLAEHRAYVWGDEFDKELCNTVRSGIKGTTPVGRYPAAPSGCVDLVGNVWELTCNAYPDDDEAIIVKGGSWYDYPAHAKIDTQFSARVNRPGNAIGFRLVYGGALRFPDFLDEELVAQCIEYRKAANESCAEVTNEDAAEFEDVISQLRDQAAVVLPGIEPPGIDISAVDAALDAFEAFQLHQEPEAEVPAEAYEPPILERAQDWILDHPRAVLASALLLATLVVAQALSGPGDAFHQLRKAASNQTALRNPRSRKVHAPVRISARTRIAKSRLDHAFLDLAEGGEEQREEAERYLIHARTDDTRDRVQEALADPDLGAAAKASLRYVLAALAELEPDKAPQPVITAGPPREGLVFFFHEVDGDMSEQLREVRCTATAEGLPVTVVYTGPHPADALAFTHRAVLGNVRIYVDKDRTLSRLWGATRVPSVAGVRKGGLAFLYTGYTGRAVLATKAAQLARDS